MSVWKGLQSHFQGFKDFSKSQQTPLSTNRKFGTVANLPRSSWSTEITPRPQTTTHPAVQKITQNTTSGVKTNRAFHKESIIPPAKHGGGGTVMIWDS